MVNKRRELSFEKDLEYQQMKLEALNELLEKNSKEGIRLVLMKEKLITQTIIETLLETK